MAFTITRRDLEIWRGTQELRAVAQTDVESAFGTNLERVFPSQRTQELYGEIVAAMDVQRELEEDGL
jgi:hypothetical protein